MTLFDYGIDNFRLASRTFGFRDIFRQVSLFLVLSLGLYLFNYLSGELFAYPFDLAIFGFLNSKSSSKTYQTDQSRNTQVSTQEGDAIVAEEGNSFLHSHYFVTTINIDNLPCDA